ncbi:DUF397 domain-containing protein [Streptomyces sp. NPDC004111]|uniref:DUF397 domain-containing protein n=1 Tax=Streptomyces sp. NPDC004111 TaxID=3364690 RepID=UPI0036B9223F
MSPQRSTAFSNGSGGECVEFAPLAQHAAVRDSKFPGGPALALSHPTWAVFVRAVQRGALKP